MRRFRFGRFVLYLAILFFICFWFSGGNRFFDAASFDAAKIAARQDLPSMVKNAANSILSKEDNAPASEESHWDRAYRLLALKSAVDEKIRTRSYVPLDRISPALQQALIATEDSRFYQHPGFDIEGILRAGLVNLQYGEVAEGGSTITQQLVKNLFLSHDRSLARKAEELALAVDMELRYSKEEILELYLNTIYFGSGFYGINEASVGYFAKLPSELTLAEAAMLAGLPNAPSVYSPYVDFQSAKKRQAIVLDRMAKVRYIDPETAKKTKSDPLHLANEAASS